MPGIFLLNPAPVYQDPNRQVVHEDATITANGSSVLIGYGATEITLFVNVKSAPSGTSPTLQYTIQEVDPGDGTTAIGASANSTVISGVSVQKVVLLSTHGGTFKISWVIGGTDTPTFTGVYATVVAKAGSVTLADSSGAAFGSSTNPIVMQGSVTGTPLPVSGSFTATNPSVGSNNATAPTSSTQVGGSDGTNLQAARVFDADSGAGSQWVLGVQLRASGSGGSTEIGTSGSPIRIDPTGSTNQPVNQGNAGTHAQRWMIGLSDGSSSFISPATDRTTAAGPFSIRLSDGSSFYNAPTSSQLPTSLVGGRLDTNLGAWLGSTAPTVGQKASTASIPVVIANDQSSIAVTASNPSVGTTGSTLPTSATEIGGSDGTNLQTPRVFDADSGAGTQWVLGVQLRASGSGGSTEIGTSGSPIRIDPTGTTNQPVNQGSAGTHAQRWMIGLSDGSGFISPATDRTTAAGPFSVRLSDGSSFYNAPTSTQFPSSLVGSRLDINNGAWLGSTAPTVGQKASTASIPVVIANDQSSITVTNASIGTNNATAPTSSTQMGGSDGTNLQTPRVFDADSGAGTQWVLGVQLRTSGSGGSTEIGTSGSPVRIDPTGTTTQPTKEVRAATTAVTSVAGSASSVTLLAANANRLGATVFNDSTAVLYLKLGTTASTSSYTVQMPKNAYFEMPFNYTGRVDGIWASAAGAALVTEITA